MALRLKPETRERWNKRLADRTWALDVPPLGWRPVPRSEPETPEHTDMFIKGYVD